MTTIPLFRPDYTDAEETAVRDVLRSGWPGLGPVTERFEEAFARSVGARYGVATSSCTAALQLALMCHDLKFPEVVLCPSLTFVSTAHAARYCRASVEFADVRHDTLCLDIWDAARRLMTDVEAVVAVAYAGQPIDYGSTLEGRPIIYDCAHAAGSGFNAAGKTCCWSFHAVKNLACGDGGMLTTDSPDLAARARRLRWLGIDRSTWDRTGEAGYSWQYAVPEIGLKCHMNDLTAAIGLVQLERLPAMQARRREVAARYGQRLQDIVELPAAVEGHGWHLYVIRTDRRDELHEHLKRHGVATSVHYEPIHRHPCYRWEGDLPVTDRESQRILSLPMHPRLTDQQVDHVCDLVEQFHA